MANDHITVVGTDVFGLRCPSCKLSSEYMDFTKSEIEKDNKLSCKECDVELVENKKMRPVFQGARCPACNIGFTRARTKTCHYCGSDLEIKEG